jgi:6-phosphogluconolactonase
VEQIRRWHIYPTVDELEAYAARAVLRAAAQAIEERGRFRVVLAGGNTPQRIYGRLRAVRADWERWHVYFGDERCLPAGDALRNDRMARDVWLDHVPIPPAQIHAIPAELGAREAARRYAATLAPVERFDFVLLGLGEDGHTASLFPDHPGGNGADVVAVRDAPKPPPERVSLTAARLGRARQVMFVVSGTQKRRAVAAWRRGDPVPAATVTLPAGVDILLDTTAWPDPFV